MPVQEDKNAPLGEFILFHVLHEQIYQQNSILQAHCIPSSLSRSLGSARESWGETWHALGFRRSTHHVHRADTKVPTETWGN